MQIFTNTNIDFMSKRRIATVISSILLIISVASLAIQGLNFGIDFTGGTMIELDYKKEANLEQIRNTLAKDGYHDVTVQNFGSVQDVLIRLPVFEGQKKSELSNHVVDLLQAQSEDKIDVRRVEFVGPQVGDELTEDGGLAMLYALFGILVYVALRFEYRFAIGSVVALIHDVVITLGYFSVFRVEFDLTVLAAILAIIGYSLNDTIVVFDRIRETFLRKRKDEPVAIVNAALNDTLSRTLMTSFTTILVVFALFIFGGDVIHDFSLALLLGIGVGTYSSIYVASNVTLAMGVSKQDLMPVKKDDDPEANPDGSQV
jgi:preprotein translocase subunit SecF